MLAAFLLVSCNGMPQLFWENNADGGGKLNHAKGASAADAEKRAPLDVPPELRAEMALPGQDKIATQTDSELLPESYREAVAGKSVSLDARVYQVEAGDVFSAVVDAMTSLNLPVQSVDSPSGIITSDWIRKGSNSGNIAGAVMSAFSSDATHAPTKHRFIVRVFRATSGDQPMSKLEIRVLGQQFTNGRWVNKPFKRKVSEELFAAVDEQLTRMKREKEK